MTTAERWDVVVVGGGPAGATTAALLATQGYRVLILDRENFPRTKPCGESVNPGAIQELDSLGLLPAVLRLTHVRLKGWRIHPYRGLAFDGHFPPDSYGIGIERASFDRLLLDHAVQEGAEVRTLRVDDLLWEDGAVVGVRALRDGRRHLIRSRLVVGADGLRSVVVRRLGLVRRKPRLRKLALTAHVSGANLPGETGELHLHRWGCLGAAPVAPGVANVVAVLNREQGDVLNGDRTRFFEMLLRTLPYLEGTERISEVMATGPFDWPTRAVTAPGALLVGDAAGYFDPFTGQGIFRALRGGRLAAAAADLALRSARPSAGPLAEYKSAHRQAFASRVAVQHVIELATARPLLFNGIAAVLRSHPALPNRLVAVTGDVGPVRSPMTPGPYSLGSNSRAAELMQ